VCLQNTGGHACKIFTKQHKKHTMTYGTLVTASLKKNFVHATTSTYNRSFFF
jgi:hypothetical protein